MDIPIDFQKGIKEAIKALWISEDLEFSTTGVVLEVLGDFFFKECDS